MVAAIRLPSACGLSMWFSATLPRRFSRTSTLPASQAAACRPGTARPGISAACRLRRWRVPRRSRPVPAGVPPCSPFVGFFGLGMSRLGMLAASSFACSSLLACRSAASNNGQRQCADQSNGFHGVDSLLVCDGRAGDERLAGEPLDFDQGALGVQRGVELLLARSGALGLQLRPFQVADGTGAIGALRGSSRPWRAWAGRPTACARLRAAPHGSGRAPRPGWNTATAPATSRSIPTSASSASAARISGSARRALPSGIDTLPISAKSSVACSRRTPTCQSRSGVAWLRASCRRASRMRRSSANRASSGVASSKPASSANVRDRPASARGSPAAIIESRVPLAPQGGQMLACGDQALLRTVAIQFGARQCRLRGQHHRFRRCTRMQSLPGAGHRALALR